MKTHNTGKIVHLINPRKLTKPAALCISALFIMSILSAFAFCAVHGATASTATFGNTAIGSQANYFGTDKDASRFQLTQNGQVQSITTYFTSTGFSAKAAIYTDNNGAPNTLIAQSSSQSVTTTGWTTFTVTQSALTPGYYWLCVISSSSSATGTMTSSSSNTHAWKNTVYANEYTSTFGTPTGYEQTTTSIYATYTPTTASTATFGNTAIGSQANYFGTDKDASRFQLTQNGQVQSITTYFTSTGFSAKAAIYTDNNGAPNTLIAQSSSQSVTTTGWTTFTVTQSALTPGYYWLCVISSSSSATGTMTSSSSNTHAWKNTVYANEYTSTFGTPTGYEQTTTSIYATYTPTTTTPTPTPASPTNGNSLISINDGDWYTDSEWLQCPALNVQLDTTDTYGGSPSWEITLSSVNMGADYGGLSVAPGDTVVFSCWIKTSAATLAADQGNPQAGGEIGIDIYGASGCVCGLCTPNGVGSPTNTVNNYVEFGTYTWTQVTMSFTVPSSYQAVAGYGGGRYAGGQWVTPTAIIPWLIVWSDTQGSNEHGTAWFADTQLTITPP